MSFQVQLSPRLPHYRLSAIGMSIPNIGLVRVGVFPFAVGQSREARGSVRASAAGNEKLLAPRGCCAATMEKTKNQKIQKKLATQKTRAKT